MTTKKSISARKLLKSVFRSSFGEFVRDIRECDEISQTELAKRMCVSRQFIHAIEKDKANISLEMAIKIASALGYPCEAFVEIFLNDILRKSGIKKLFILCQKRLNRIVMSWDVFLLQIGQNPDLCNHMIIQENSKNAQKKVRLKYHNILIILHYFLISQSANALRGVLKIVLV